MVVHFYLDIPFGIWRFPALQGFATPTHTHTLLQQTHPQGGERCVDNKKQSVMIWRSEKKRKKKGITHTPERENIKGSSLSKTLHLHHQLIFRQKKQASPSIFTSQGQLVGVCQRTVWNSSIILNQEEEEERRKNRGHHHHHHSAATTTDNILKERERG